MSNKKSWEIDLAFASAYVGKSAAESQPEVRGLELILLIGEVFARQIEESSMKEITKRQDMLRAFQ